MFDNIPQETHGLPEDGLVRDYMSPFDVANDEGEQYEYWFFFNEDGTVDSGTYIVSATYCTWLRLDIARRKNYELPTNI